MFTYHVELGPVRPCGTPLAYPVSVAVTLASILLAGCGPAIDELDPSELGTATEPIIYGHDADAIRNKVAVRVTHAGGACSGSLLNNSWVITAGHCIDANLIARPWNLSISLADRGLGVAAEIIPEPDGLDVALIRLRNTAVVDGSTSGHQVGLYTGYPKVGLKDHRLYCWGFGRSTLTTPRSGQLLMASLRVSAAGRDWVRVKRNTSGQVPFFGDSGGPALYDTPRGSLVAGVQSYVDNPDYPTTATYVSLHTIWRWVLRTINRAAYTPPTHWTRPLPNDFADTERWTPCGTDHCYSWRGQYALEQRYDFAYLGSTDERHSGYVDADIRQQGLSFYPSATLNGSGTAGGQICGTMGIRVTTDRSVRSDGIRALSASCPDVLCHGVTCMTTPDQLPHRFNSTRRWDPCDGGCFAWVASYDFEPRYDHGYIGELMPTGWFRPLATLNGSNGIKHGSHCGPVLVRAQTDASVSSAGIKWLEARCLPH